MLLKLYVIKKKLDIITKILSICCLFEYLKYVKWKKTVMIVLLHNKKQTELQFSLYMYTKSLTPGNWSISCFYRTWGTSDLPQPASDRTSEPSTFQSQPRGS